MWSACYGGYASVGDCIILHKFIALSKLFNVETPHLCGSGARPIRYGVGVVVRASDTDLVDTDGDAAVLRAVHVVRVVVEERQLTLRGVEQQLLQQRVGAADS